MLEVVCVLPRPGGRGGVPFPGGRVDVRVAHPVPLPVHDVVPELHVLDHLRERERDGARRERRPVARAEQQRAAGELQRALRLDDASHVRRVARAEVRADLRVERVELGCERRPRILVEMGRGRGVRHRRLR